MHEHGGRPTGPLAQGRYLNLGTPQLPIFAAAPSAYARSASVRDIAERVTATGATVTLEQQHELARSDPRTLRWLQCAMDLVATNTGHKGQALADDYLALWACSRHDTLAQPGAPGERFERQVLATVGWFKGATASMVQPPDPRTLQALAQIYNPPRPIGRDVPVQHAVSISAPTTDDATLAILADLIQEIAQVYFAPFVRTTEPVRIERVRAAPSAQARRWASLYALCREQVRALQHPELVARAPAISRGEIVTQGFVEALAFELKLVLYGAAMRNPDLRAVLEAGVPEDIAEPPAPMLDHADAAVPALRILRAVGSVAARQAFFLGAVELVGLAPGQLCGADAGEGTRPVALPAPDAASAIALDAQDHIDQLAHVQVFRHQLRERFTTLLAYQRAHAPDDVLAPAHDDHAWAVHARIEAAAFRQALPRLRRALADLPETALKLEITVLLDELERWTLVFVLSFSPRQ